MTGHPGRCGAAAARGALPALVAACCLGACAGPGGGAEPETPAVAATGADKVVSGDAAPADEEVAAVTTTIVRGAAVPPPLVPATIPVERAPRRPFVQLGRFTVEANARNAALRLAEAGLPARAIPERGSAAWRLLLGPAATRAEQARLLQEAVAQGFADAYLVAS
jgi:cell division septation protein DedD